MTRWPTAPLGDVARLERDMVPPECIEAGTAYVGLEHIESGGKILPVAPVASGELKSTKFAFTSEHILYGKLRPYLAKIALPSFSGVCTTEIVPVAVGPRMDRRFLAHFLRQPDQIELATARSTGANLPRLSPTELAKFDVPVPPLAEQRRIAAILDEADALRAKRRVALAKLDEMARAIFVEMFGDLRTNSRDWPLSPVGSYVAEFQGGKSLEADPDNAAARHKVLKISAVTSGIFRPEECKPLPDTYDPPAEHFVKCGDLLFSRANTTELVGAVANVELTPPDLVLPDKLWRFVWRAPRRVEPLFIWALFQDPSVREEIGRRATGTSGSMKNISQAKLLSMPTILPPLNVQQVFVERLRSLNAQRAAHEAATAAVDSLFASLQHRAFRGEL